MFNAPYNTDVIIKFPNWLYYKVIPVQLDWIELNKMTNEQKNRYGHSKFTEGFLLVETIKDWDSANKEAAQKSWNETTEEDRQLTFKLPNFDASIFFEIFGIDVRDKTECSETITLNGKTYHLIED